MTDDGRLPTLSKLGDRFAQLERKNLGEERPRSGFRLGLAFGSALLLTLFVVATPPGRSLASAVGELIGIGDPAPAPEGEGAVYIDFGEAGKTRYEVVAVTSNSDSRTPETCFEVEFPDIESTFSVANCVTGPSVRAELERESIKLFPYRTPGDLGPDAALVVQGPTAAKVSSVEVSFEGESIPVYFSRLDETLSAQIGSLDQAGFVIAVLPSDVLSDRAGDGDECPVEALSSVEITTLDSNGDVLAVTDLGEKEYLRSLSLIELPSADAPEYVPPGTPPVKPRDPKPCSTAN